MVVVITDGASSDHDILVNESSLMKQASVTVLAVSVGFVTHPQELHAMAGQRVLSVKSYAELLNRTDDVVRLICDMTLTTYQPATAATTVSPVSPSLSLISTPGQTNTDQLSTHSPASPPPSDTPGNSSGVERDTLTTPNQQFSSDRVCQGRAVDIVVIVDSSHSVGLNNFLKIKHFLTSLVAIFDIGQTKTRVGIMVFSDDAKMVIRLEDMTNKTDLKYAIQNIQYTGGGTNTAAALKLLSYGVFSRSSRPQSVPRVGVVLTDGLSRNTLLTKIQAEHLHAMDVQLFAIGVGSKASIVELETIGSKPSAQFVIAMADFNDLSFHGAHFVASACKTFPRWEDLLTTNTTPNLLHENITGISTASSGLTTAVPVHKAENEQCFDVHDNCHGFGRDVCSDYEQWARAHCAATCRFCSRNASEELCEDNIANCNTYGTYICENPFYLKWAWENCAVHCGLCDANNGIKTTEMVPVNATGHANNSDTPTTATPFLDPDCSDTISDCANYGGYSACVDYHAWASVRCREYCGFCSRFVVYNSTIVNGIRCPEWKLPIECTMDSKNGTCCPTPNCPDGFVLTAKREN
ncbi:collagen alpha-1(XII) chain-like [Elysia marginata]|uniref:Collagen alpha-1(XII) chain-like n=1 Tax=Elysia marginata TaxID=1093978 RepID=A0AAV4IMR9_9GAST|nr:collagen alpha-1(XII) chain-like [Elysia marginata]